MRIGRIIVGGLLAAGISLGGGTAAMAATVYPAEGGTWNHGVVGGVHLYSDYFNQNLCHGSSTRNDWGTSRSLDVAANVWANSAQRTTPIQNNRAYYRTC